MWCNSLNAVKTYIDVNKKQPSQHDKDKDIKRLARWIINQKQKYLTNNEKQRNSRSLLKIKSNGSYGRWGIYNSWNKTRQ